jgi:Mn2+/Fe2+ NRAMP family transporter
VSERTLIVYDSGTVIVIVIVVADVYVVDDDADDDTDIAALFSFLLPLLLPFSSLLLVLLMLAFSFAFAFCSLKSAPSHSPTFLLKRTFISIPSERRVVCCVGEALPQPDLQSSLLPPRGRLPERPSM